MDILKNGGQKILSLFFCAFGWPNFAHGAYIYFLNRKVFLFNLVLFFYIQVDKFCVIVFVDLLCNYFVELFCNIESSCDILCHWHWRKNVKIATSIHVWKLALTEHWVILSQR